MPNISFSIIIVTRHRQQLLEQCLESIAQNHPQGLEQIFVVINADPCAHVKHSLLPIEVIELTSHHTPGAARNAAIDRVKSQYCLFLDDDITLSPQYFEKALDFIQQHQPQVLGGPDTEYHHINWLEKSINYALQSPMTTGTTYRRHTKNHTTLYNANEQTLTLANLWVERQLIQKYKFNPLYVRSEENEFLLRSQPQKMCLCTDFWVHHKRKTDLIHLFKTIFISGSHRSLLLKQFGIKAGLTYFVPLILFLLFLILLQWLPSGALFLLGVYFTLSLYMSFAVGKKLALVVLPLQICININYTLGVAAGLILLRAHTYSKSN